MTQTNLFGEYVKTRMVSLGHHFALHRDCEYLGHQSKNMLQVLIATSKMPTSSRCFQPDANLDANLSKPQSLGWHHDGLRVQSGGVSLSCARSGSSARMCGSDASLE